MIVSPAATSRGWRRRSACSMRAGERPAKTGRAATWAVSRVECGRRVAGAGRPEDGGEREAEEPEADRQRTEDQRRGQPAAEDEDARADGTEQAARAEGGVEGAGRGLAPPRGGPR